nr:PREDICTED: deleted in autism protein 1 [Latimeria chalumnae]XP_006001960.1 PREDICTED: deleted in autism protein 1 [Latimeria chalumnae]XP_014347432.1 PREDICTED: deleted in autism protein 1 [Latimeria chalumnae]|eukprot:XP_006001959.1 PREDICTED: deleted in autism protein 1 [Latimeria chalumnae]
MLRFLSLKFGRLYRYLKFIFLVSLLVVMLMNTQSLFASFQKNELMDRRFINLNKCPACFGTSWCRKFMNGQITFETWGRLRFLDFFNVKNVYFAQYGEPREGTRRIVLKRMGSNQELADIDQKICKRATGRPRCDLIQAVYKTEFARLNGEVRLLTPEVVEGWSDLVYCPSQRLLDRIVRRYAETKDSGSFLLKNLKDTERMQLLLTLAFNPEPLVLQIDLKTGMSGMKASLKIVIKKPACHSQRTFCVPAPLLTTITMPSVRTYYPNMPPGVAHLEDFFMIPLQKLPKMADLRPCLMSVLILKNIMVVSKQQKNCVNTL